MKLLIATGNRNKLDEFGRILAPLGIEIISPAEAGAVSDAEENGETFADNAYIKAWDLFCKTGLPTVADDSGLCVDALDGRPGVHSARYHGEDTPYPEKMAALLDELKDVPAEKRTARFVAAICCIIDRDTVIRCEGVCEGSIAFQTQGSGGFGYDPIFLVEGGSFASLSGEDKDKLSHRGRALRELSGKLSAQMSGNHKGESK